MEPNIQNTPTTPIQPPQQTPVVNQPIASTTPETLIMPATPITSPPPEKSNKMLFLILAVLIITVVGIGGLFFLTNKQNPAQEAKIAAPIVVPQVSPSPTPTLQPTQTPEQALQEVTIEDAASDITDINADISQL